MNRCLLLPLALCLVTSAPAAELSGLDVKYISDSNPAKAEFDRDIEGSSSLRLRLTGNLLALTLASSEATKSGLSVNGSASYEHNADIDPLGESRFRVSLDWFREARQVSASPFLRAGIGIGYIDSETQIRDGSLMDISASVNLQPTQFFDTTLGVQSAIRNAETEVFDTTQTTLFLTANFSPVPRLVLRSGLRYVMGDEVSTATPTLNIVNSTDVIEPDEAFGGSTARRFAYLVDADSAIAELGMGYSLSGTLQANLMYRFVNTEAKNGIGYERSLIEFTLSLDL